MRIDMLYTSFLSVSQSESWASEMWSKHTFEIKLELVDLHFSPNAALLYCDLFLKYSAHFQQYVLHFTFKFTGVYSCNSEIKNIELHRSTLNKFKIISSWKHGEKYNCWLPKVVSTSLFLVGWPWLDDSYSPKLLCHSSPQLGRGKKI